MDGVIKIYLDGIEKTAAQGGCQNALLTKFSSTVGFGVSGASDNKLDGYIGSIDFNNSGDPKDFPQ
jgi:hypothetical protein